MGTAISDKIEKIYPLSPLQEGLYFLKMKDESSSQYVVQNVVELEGKVTSEMIVDVFRLMSLKYDILRTILHSKSTDKPIQIVLKEKYVECNCLDFTSFIENEVEEKLEKAIKSDLKRGFNFKTDSLMRVTVIKIKDEKFTLLWTFHHIIMDGWSLGILKNSFDKYMNQLIDGNNFNTLKKEIEIERKNQPEYSNYIKWFESVSLLEGENYWMNYLKDYEEIADIKPYGGDLGFPDIQLNVEVVTSSKLTNEIMQTADQLHITYSEIFETCWGLLLQQFSNSNDAVFGKVVSGRNASIAGVEQIVGLFINTIPTRINCTSNPALYELLQNIHENSLKSTDYDCIPLSMIQSCSKQGSELIRSIYTFENYYIQPDEIENKYKLRIKKSREQTNYNLSLLIYEDSSFHVRLMYHPHRYSEIFAKDIVQKYLDLIQTVVADTKKKVSEMELINKEEKQKIFHCFNGPITYKKNETTITKLFQNIVYTYPNKTALIFKKESMSYKRLDDTSNIIANYLADCGVKSEDYVGLFCDKSMEMIIAMVGIIKAGAAYVPIDPTFPQERIKYIIKDCKPILILTTQEELHLSIKTKKIKEILSREDRTSFHPESKILGNNLAYLIYTSGTTGKPKGVAVEHKGIVNLSQFFKTSFDVTSKDNILQFANYVFDASVWEITMAILTGATLVITPNEYTNDVMNFEKYCADNKVTVATLPPQFYIQTSNLNTRLLITAGSEANAEIVHKALEKGRYVNAYGPTETTVCATYYEHIAPFNIVNDVVPIGKPIDNTQVYIIKEDKLCGIGIPGELYIAGVGLAREYLNKYELTNEKFISNPFGDGKLYRTGDLARWLPDGNIDFLGRIDTQIKIRGFRMEPGEIESAIRKIKDVIDVAVTAVKIENGEKVLAAFIVSKIDMEAKRVKDEVRKYLPTYMIPDFIIQIDRIPVTRSGKLDKALLPQINSICKTEYVAPCDELEENLCSCIQDAMKLRKIGTYDNIFDFGATSLTIINIILRTARNGINLTIQNLYDYPTVNLLRNYLKNNKHQNYFIESPNEYKRLNYLLNNNVIKDTYVKSENQLKSVLITGASGFLGVHILSELLLQEISRIYCVIRGKTLDESKEKLCRSMNYYFGEDLNLYLDRVTVICADITDADIVNKLPSHVDCIIHAAANIKHFGNKSEFRKTNVSGTQNMLSYAQKANSKFAYISTSSVCGNVFEDEDIWEFSEQNYFINQIFISPYMRTKFDAEKLVLEAKEGGLDCYVIRVGNLTNRMSDGRTMKDLETNRFYSLVNAYITLGYISDKIENSQLEFSPVDLTAKGVLVLIKSHKKEETVYHLFNNQKVHMRDLIDILSKFGYKFKKVSEDILIDKIQSTLLKEDENRIYEAIKRTDVYDLEKPVKEIELNSTFTDWILACNGFTWKETNCDYLEKVISFWNNISSENIKKNKLV